VMLKLEHVLTDKLTAGVDVVYSSRSSIQKTELAGHGDRVRSGKRNASQIILSSGANGCQYERLRRAFDASDLSVRNGRAAMVRTRSLLLAASRITSGRTGSSPPTR